MLLASVVLVGVGARIGYAVALLDDVPLGFDAIWYQLQGASIRTGTGYVQPPSLFLQEQVPTAGFPPAYPLYQAMWQSLVGAQEDAWQFAGLPLGAVTIALTGIVGRDFVGPSAGLAAAALVALDPTLVAIDGSSMSESLTVPLVIGVVLCGARDASVGWAIGIGVLSGIAALTRTDLVVVTGCVVAASLLGRPMPRGRRVRGVLIVLSLMLLITVPWVVRNQRQVQVLAIATTSPSSAIAGANCDATYFGDDLGSWSFPCVAAAAPVETVEAELSAAQRDAAVSYVRGRVGRVPVVVAARLARVWAFWDPRDLARRDAEETRHYRWQVLSRPFDAVLLIVGLLGLARLVRQRRSLAPWGLLLVPIVSVCASAVVSYGNPRFNGIAHPVLAIGASALAASVWRPPPSRGSGVSDDALR